MQNLLKSRQVLAAVFLSSLFVSISGCDLEDRGQAIKKHQLQNELKVGQVLRLSSLLNTSDGVVCMLPPYWMHVPKKVLQSARINAWLEASGYKGDESHWAFVVAESDRIHLSKFRRSEKLDVVTRSIQPGYETQLPPGFVPIYCASLARAVITKIAWKNRSEGRIYLIMGEIQ